MEWLKSSEKLPERGKRVLVYSVYGIQIGWLTANNDWQFCNDGHQFAVEHWMPLPDLPCEGKSDSTSEKDLRVCNVTTRYLIEAVENKLVLDRAFVSKEELVEGYKRLFKMNFPNCEVYVATLNGW